MIVFLAVLAALVFAAGFLFLAPSFLVTRLAEQKFLSSLAAEDQAAGRDITRRTILRVRSTGEVIAEVRLAVAQLPRASALLERFFAAGEGISVTSFLIRKDGTMALSGHATTRAQLLRFEETLRASDRFHEITFPLSNIVRERDIEFSMQGKLKPDYGL